MTRVSRPDPYWERRMEGTECGYLRPDDLNEKEKEWCARYTLVFGPEAAWEGLVDGESEFYDEMGKALWPRMKNEFARIDRCIDIILSLRKK